MRPSTRSPATLRQALLALLLLLLVLVAVGACSADDGTAANGGSHEVAAAARDDSDDEGLSDGIRPIPSSGADEAGRSGRTTAQTQAIIATSSVRLRADEVQAVRDEVAALATERGGVIARERSESDEAGDLASAALVLRIPIGDFDDTLAQLKSMEEFVSDDSAKEDVTTEVIDTGVRIEAQRRIIRRIEALLDRAQDIPDVVRIESELTRRQATLDSLLAQRTYLADQTSLATIEVEVFRSDAPEVKPEEERGFVAGLGAGWSGLKTFTVGLLTVLGALLPFLAILLVLALPTWLLARRLVRRPLGGPPAQATGSAGGDGTD